MKALEELAKMDSSQKEAAGLSGTGGPMVMSREAIKTQINNFPENDKLVFI